VISITIELFAPENVAGAHASGAPNDVSWWSGGGLPALSKPIWSGDHAAEVRPGGVETVVKEGRKTFQSKKNGRRIERRPSVERVRTV
jgi:hypothetical protein